MNDPSVRGLRRHGWEALPHVRGASHFLTSGSNRRSLDCRESSNDLSLPGRRYQASHRVLTSPPPHARSAFHATPTVDPRKPTGPQDGTPRCGCPIPEGVQGSWADWSSATLSDWLVILPASVELELDDL